MPDMPMKHLAWFLGPKAEQGELVEKLIVAIIRDYCHWRKNYFPGDPILLDSITERSLATEQDELNQAVDELMAQLRRNFPFYSPRYIAHQLSDTLIPSTVGYLAGMLFNPNNITPEAAPVTTELELEACGAILKMLGFRRPPAPPPPTDNSKVIEYYAKQNQREYGWAHLTSGGTVANIEALWIARQVKYFPLAVQDIARQKALSIEIKLPSSNVLGSEPYSEGESTPKIDIRSLDSYQLTLLKPNEAIYLLPKFIQALAQSSTLSNSEPEREKDAWKLLNTSRYSLSNGVGNCFAEFPPRVFIAGTRHYSLTKAVDLLGIGKSNIVAVAADQNFRMDIADLDRLIAKCIAEKHVPLCVVATAGTTEEGAVDQIDRVLDLRLKFERERNASFWIHIDAAWGGFFRSLFNLAPEDRVNVATLKMSNILGIEFCANASQWHTARLTPLIKDLFRNGMSAESVLREADQDPSENISAPPATEHEAVQSLATEESSREVSEPPRQSGPAPDDDVTKPKPEPLTEAQIRERLEQKTIRELTAMERALSGADWDDYVRLLLELPQRLASRLQGFSEKVADSYVKGDLRLTESDILQWLSRYVSEEVEIKGESATKTLTLNWPRREVANAFMAFPLADSITIDPHKMGFQHYPSGCIAFKNDLVRLFVWQHAPYITSTVQNSLVHVPPRHTSLDPTSRSRIEVDSFSPFILEGSRPGAAAAALWLSNRVLPLTPAGHGVIVKESILAARTLYEWLKRWNGLHDKTEEGLEYQFIPLTPDFPDTNIVIFTVKKKTSNSLKLMNTLTKRVYEKFTIQSELGEREYSYSQPFFLSKTTFTSDDYPWQTISNFVERCQLSESARQQYLGEGIVVLRATVMNPYVNVARKSTREQDYIRLFMNELGRAAQQHASQLSSK